MTDDDSVITYKRLIFSASLPVNNYSSSPANHRRTGSEIGSVAQDGPFRSLEGENTSPVPKPFPSMSSDNVAPKSIKQTKSTTYVDLPSDIRWTGVGRKLPDFSVPSPTRYMEVALISPQQELSPFDFSSGPSREMNEGIKQDIGKADRTLTPTYFTHSISNVSPVASRAPHEFNNLPGDTHGILMDTPVDRGARKGLSALKAMSSERRNWDSEDPRSDVNPQFDTHFNTQSFEVDIIPQAKQPQTQPPLISAQIVETTPSDFTYGIPQYRRHVVGHTPPSQEAPPPVPFTPLPDEAGMTKWRSSHTSVAGEMNGTKSYFRQSASTKESDPSKVTQNMAASFDSSNTNITLV